MAQTDIRETNVLAYPSQYEKEATGALGGSGR